MLCLPLLAFAQTFDFQPEYDTIPLYEDSVSAIPVPWYQGYEDAAPATCDIDADGDLDLFIGCWRGRIDYFQNVGTSASPSFELTERDYQDLYPGWSNSTPCFCDIDADGDYDLICDWGDIYMKLYINEGTPVSPDFVLTEDPLRDSDNSVIDSSDPALVDLDADGDLDLIAPQWYYGIYYYENTGDSTDYEFTLVTTSFAGIGNSFWRAATFCDIDADGDFDMFIGEYYGTVTFYENIGTPQQYQFASPVGYWAGINYAYNANPEFCDLDDDGDYDLVVGSEYDLGSTAFGSVYYYENVGDAQNPDFVEVTSNFLTFDGGWTVFTHFADADLDGDYDLFFDNESMLGWMENIGTQTNPSFVLRSHNILGPFSPSNWDVGDLTGDGAVDVIQIAGWLGTLDIWENENLPGEMSFVPMGSIATVHYPGCPDLEDMDNDGDLDLIVSGFAAFPNDPVVMYYENTGSPTDPHFTYVTDNYQGLNSYPLETYLPVTADMDLDGDYDLMMMYPAGTIWYFENTGTPWNAQFQLITEDLLGESSINLVPRGDAVDIDSDGDVDFFAGDWCGGIVFYRNYAASVNLTLTPMDSVITLPATGGSFDFTITVENNSAAQATFDVWCDVTLPDSTPFGPLIGPVNVTVPGQFSTDRDRTQLIPAGAPTGVYQYNGYIGLYPNTVWSQDHFDFEKLAEGDGFIVEGWNNFGEPFDAWAKDSPGTKSPADNSLKLTCTNPVNPTGWISFELPQAQTIDLSIYNLLGQKVATLVHGYNPSGMKRYSWNAVDYSSGMYFVRLETDIGFSSHQITVIK